MRIISLVSMLSCLCISIGHAGRTFENESTALISSFGIQIQNFGAENSYECVNQETAVWK